MERIETERLTLLPLTLAQLQLCLDDPQALAAELDLMLAAAMITDIARRAIQMKIDKMRAAPEADHAWHTYWLPVIRESGIGVGLLGFKGAPDVEGKYDLIGEVEIGYGIAPEFSGYGYTTEAACALILWAFAHPDCNAVIAAEVLKSNRASIRVLEKIGMIPYYETDETLFYRLDRP